MVDLIFKEHGKICAAFVNSLNILLYVGCTESVYIKSKVVEVKPEELKTAHGTGCSLV